MELSSRFSASGIGGLQVLSVDGGLAFCRGWRDGEEGGRHGVLIVHPASEQSSPATLDGITHEYSFKNELESAWAVRPLELLHDRGRTVLVLEYFGGEQLSGLLGAPMELERFLYLATGVAAALGKVHQHGLIHKDIKPANILCNAASGEVRLTGFGIASRLARERQPVEPPELIGGTLAYMAPEQTGRMNRSIDSRSDLYSLGVTFYQMLTGSLPFDAVDAMAYPSQFQRSSPSCWRKLATTFRPHGLGPMTFSPPRFHVADGLERVGQENSDAESRENCWR